MEEMAAIAVFFMLVGLPIILHHQRKMAEMRVKSGSSGDQTLMSELLQLKAQIAEMRDSTTKYDLSFDAALQRIESRVGHLESRISTIEQETSSVRTR